MRETVRPGKHKHMYPYSYCTSTTVVLNVYRFSLNTLYLHTIIIAIHSDA